MKQLNIWKTSFYTMLAIAAGAFTACVDDDVDKQAPTLELSEEAVAFTGTATEDATVTVRSNRQWTVAYEDEETQKEWMYFKVSGNEVSEGIYNGDGTVKITVGESAQPHMGRLIFTLSNSYGELYRKYLTVTQGNYVPPTVGAVGKLVEYILGNSDLSGAVGSDKAMPLNTASRRSRRSSWPTTRRATTTANSTWATTTASNGRPSFSTAVSYTHLRAHET